MKWVLNIASDSFRLIVLIAVNVSLFLSLAMASEDISQAKSIGEKDTVQREKLLELAHILAGKDIATKYFKGLDLTKVKRIGFVSSSIASDLRYVDTISNPCRFEVERKNYDFSGRLSKTEIVPLSEAEFFSRIDYVRKYIEKHGDLPNSPIDLLKIHSQIGTDTK